MRNQVNVRLSAAELVELDRLPGANRAEKLRELLRARTSYEQISERVAKLEGQVGKLGEKFTNLTQAINERVQVIRAVPREQRSPGG